MDLSDAVHRLDHPYLALLHPASFGLLLLLLILLHPFLTRIDRAPLGFQMRVHLDPSR